MVLDHEDAERPARAGGWWRWRDVQGRPGGQRHAEGSAPARAVARRADRAAVQLDEALDERQPQTEAAATPIERALALHEEVEDALEEWRRHARPGVGHLEGGPVRLV